MALFEAYYDESGTHEGSQIVAVSGVVSRQSCWLTIMEQWKSTLSKCNISHYRTSRLSNFQPPFKSWDKERRNELTTKLLDIFKNNEVLLLGICVEHQEYIRVRSEYPHASSLSPYNFCVMASIGQLINRADSLENGSIAVTLESGQEKGSVPIRDLQERELTQKEISNYYKLSSLTVADKKVFRQLELADLVVYEHYKYECGVLSGRKKPRYSFNRLVKESPNELGKLDEEGITMWLERFSNFFGKQ